MSCLSHRGVLVLQYLQLLVLACILNLQVKVDNVARVYILHSIQNLLHVLCSLNLIQEIFLSEVIKQFPSIQPAIHTCKYVLSSSTQMGCVLILLHTAASCINKQFRRYASLGKGQLSQLSDTTTVDKGSFNVWIAVGQSSFEGIFSLLNTTRITKAVVNRLFWWDGT